MSTYKRSTKQEEEQQFRYPAYEKSDALRQAEAQLQQHTASQPSAYQSQYKDQMSSLLTELDNRPEFRYDADGDALYRQYKDAYIRNGRRAMEDTMGQAAALTGGYGSSYAQSVGQQAYNQYMTGLNDVIPELYQLALSKYNQQTADLQNRYAMYETLDAKDYSRWQDQQNAWYKQLDRLTSNARYEAEKDWEEYASGYKDAYGQYQEELKKLSPVDPASYASYADFLSAKSYDGKYLLDPDDEFGGTVTYNNGSVSNGNIMAMQRALGLEDNAMWSVKEKKLTNMTANEAWDAYQRGALQNFKSVSRTPISNTGTISETIGNTGGFTGKTYEEAVAYMKSKGVGDSAANVMTRNEWRRRKEAYEVYGTGGAEVKNYASYEKYLADYVEYAIESKGR